MGRWLYRKFSLKTNELLIRDKSAARPLLCLMLVSERLLGTRETLTLWYPFYRLIRLYDKTCEPIVGKRKFYGTTARVRPRGSAGVAALSAAHRALAPGSPPLLPRTHWLRLGRGGFGARHAAPRIR